MHDPTSYEFGADGVVLFMGVIEDMSSDPLKMGRARVRIFGCHNADKDELPTSALPWAFPLAPVTHATLLPSYKVGDWVIGFFLDGELRQQPMIMFVVPAIPQSGGFFKSLLKTAVKTAVKSQTGGVI